MSKEVAKYFSNTHIPNEDLLLQKYKNESSFTGFILVLCQNRPESLEHYITSFDLKYKDILRALQETDEIDNYVHIYNTVIDHFKVDKTAILKDVSCWFQQNVDIWRFLFNKFKFTRSDIPNVLHLHSDFRTNADFETIQFLVNEIGALESDLCVPWHGRDIHFMEKADTESFKFLVVHFGLSKEKIVKYLHAQVYSVDYRLVIHLDSRYNFTKGELEPLCSNMATYKESWEYLKVIQTKFNYPLNVYSKYQDGYRIDSDFVFEFWEWYKPLTDIAFLKRMHAVTMDLRIFKIFIEKRYSKEDIEFHVKYSHVANEDFMTFCKLYDETYIIQETDIPMFKYILHTNSCYNLRLTVDDIDWLHKKIGINITDVVDMRLCSPDMVIEYFKPDNPTEIYISALSAIMARIFRREILVIKSKDPDVLQLNYVKYDLTKESEKVQNAVLIEYRKQSYYVQYTSEDKNEIDLTILNQIPLVVIPE
jgi:hypothetical protein